jgi:PAS domain S-box-containing protein
MPRKVLRYGIAVLSVTLALLCMIVLKAELGIIEAPFLMFFSAIMISAWYGGLAAGLLATFLSAGLSTYFFLHPNYGLTLTLSQGIFLSLFCLEGILFSVLSDRLWAANQRLRVNMRSLRNSEESYRRLVETTSEGVWVINAEGQTEYVNQRIAEMLGYSPAEILGRSLLEFMDEASRPQALKYLERRKQGISEQHEFRFYSRDGSELWVLVSASPILSKTGEFLGALGMLTDVTERKRAAVALQRSEEKFRRLYDSNLIGIAFWNMAGWVSEANDAYLQLAGCTRESFELSGGISWQELTPPEHQHLDEHALEEIRAMGTSSIYEKEYVHRDGKRVPVVLGSALLTDSQQDGVAFFLDITDRKQAEIAMQQRAEELAKFSQMKDDFLATISHELRSPLNSILGWSQMLRTRKFDEATTHRALETIERNARSQAQLVEDLLDISRIIRGQVRLTIRTVNLASILEAAIDTLLPAAEAKNIQLQTLIEPILDPVNGDSERLQQVFWNLLTNAVKFTPQNGRVQICLKQVQTDVEIAIADTGQGIKPEFLPYVFDRFSQADGSISRSFNGLGIGLAIVRHLVELQGGTIRAESPGEGQGATFIVKLPAAIATLNS